MKKNHTFLIGLAALSISANAFAAAATATNYKNVIQGIMGKFDRDFHSLNPHGVPDPGAVATLETFLNVFNGFGIKGPTTRNTYISSSDPTVACSAPASASCSHIKVQVISSTHSLTLFGSPISFTYDVIVWMDNGLGFTRFLQGAFSPVVGGLGNGTITNISCGGCSTVGHSKIEWDGTGGTTHLRATMWDTKMAGGSVFVPVLIDSFYVPNGDLKMVITGDRVCGATSTDSICDNGVSANTTGYTALLHGNMSTGNAFITGRNAVSADTGSPSTGDQMCIKADGTQDVAATVCHADGSDTFSGMTAYTINAALTTGSWAAANWPFSDITDSPTF